MADEVQIVEEKTTIASAKAPAKKAPRKKSTKKSEEIFFVKSKRKRAIARGSSKSGTGKIKVNGFDINITEPIELRRIMLEPIYVSKLTQDVAKKIDIKINVYGGGQSSQAQVIRGVIAKSIVASSGNDSLKKEYIRYDRFMIIDDARRVEPKKFKGPKARARFQKSYR